MIWYNFGAEAAFISTAVVTVGVIIYFVVSARKRPVKPINIPQ
jgi:hypothetical protein